MGKFNTGTIEIFLDESGIIHIKILNGARIDLGEAVDNFLILKQLSAGQKRLKLVDARGRWKITKEALAYSLKEDIPERTIAKAVLVSGIISKVVNIMKRNESKVPIRFFLFEHKALKWLKSF